MTQREPLDIDELLSGGHLSGAQYEQIARRVLPGKTGPQRSPVLVLSLAAVVSGGLALLFFLRDPATDDGFRAKGARATLEGAISVECSSMVPEPGGVPACRRGSILMFAVHSDAASGYLSAFATRDGDPGTGRIWYFPTADGSSPLILPNEGTRVVGQGIRIDDEHATGSYRLTLVLTPQHAARADVVDALETGNGDVLTLRFEVVD